MTCARATTSLGLALAAISLAVAPPALAGSLAVGQKAEINVDPKQMDAEKAALWKKFGGWCGIKDWHPLVAECEENKEGEDVFRTLTLKDGGKIKEKQIEYRDNFYKYAIVESPLPVKDYQAQFALTPDDDDEDEINFAWSAVFDANGKPDKDARDVIAGIFKAGLENIKTMAKADAPKK